MISFLKAAFKNIEQTGSIMESSPFLTEKMIESMDFEKPLNIVELGAGTGSITKRLLRKMNGQSTLTSFEIDPELFSKLSEHKDSRLKEVNADASLLESHFNNQSIDYIISGLPLANIPQTKKASILKACYNVLKPGGYYIQFQYSLNDFGLLKRMFNKVDSGFTLLNLPPAFVYHAQKTPC
jgi:phosphatidylethanolamine/phosphatidyl-N-methylethanolamine N-methyltransferase